MKKSIFLLFLSVFSVFMLSAQGQAKKNKGKAASAAKPKTAVTESSFQVDASKSEVVWEGKKVGGRHYGKVQVESGNLMVANGQISKGNVIVNMASITCDDIKDPEYNGKLIGHLKASDFFNTDMYPNAILEIKSVKPAKDGKVKIYGNLMIKAVSHPIAFDAIIESMTATSLSAKGKIVFNRTKYGIKYGSTMFGAAVDKAIEDIVVLDLTVVANKM